MEKKNIWENLVDNEDELRQHLGQISDSTQITGKMVDDSPSESTNQGNIESISEMEDESDDSFDDESAEEDNETNSEEDSEDAAQDE